MFFLSSSLLVSILSSQADPPTLKNLDFASAGARFSKNQGIRYKDALDGVLGLSWARFGCSWAPSYERPVGNGGTGFVDLQDCKFQYKNVLFA